MTALSKIVGPTTALWHEAAIGPFVGGGRRIPCSVALSGVGACTEFYRAGQMRPAKSLTNWLTKWSVKVETIGSLKSVRNFSRRKPGSRSTLIRDSKNAPATAMRRVIGSHLDISSARCCVATTDGLGFHQSWTVAKLNGGATFNVQDGSLRLSRPSNNHPSRQSDPFLRNVPERIRPAFCRSAGAFFRGSVTLQRRAAMPGTTLRKCDNPVAGVATGPREADRSAA